MVRNISQWQRFQVRSKRLIRDLTNIFFQPEGMRRIAVIVIALLTWAAFKEYFRLQTTDQVLLNGISVIWGQYKDSGPKGQFLCCIYDWYLKMLNFCLFVIANVLSRFMNEYFIFSVTGWIGTGDSHYPGSQAGLVWFVRQQLQAAHCPRSYFTSMFCFYVWIN